MRYTIFNEELERYTVPLLEKADGERITFGIYTDRGEHLPPPYDNIVISPPIDHIFGEVVDRLAVLEDMYETLKGAEK